MQNAIVPLLEWVVITNIYYNYQTVEIHLPFLHVVNISSDPHGTYIKIVHQL